MNPRRELPFGTQTTIKEAIEVAKAYQETTDEEIKKNYKPVDFDEEEEVEVKTFEVSGSAIAVDQDGYICKCLLNGNDDVVAASALIPDIKDISAYNENTVVVEFVDGTKEYARTRNGDVFNFEFGVTICLMKKLLSDGLPFGSNLFNNLVKYAMTKKDANRKAKEKAREEERQKKEAEKRARIEERLDRIDERKYEQSQRIEFISDMATAFELALRALTGEKPECAECDDCECESKACEQPEE